MSEVMRQLWPKKPGLPKEEDVLFRTSEVLGEQDDNMMRHGHDL